MRRRLVAIGLAVVISSALLPQGELKSAEPTTRDEDELVNLVREWLNAEARNDRPALDRMIADDFLGRAFGGNIVTKSDVVPPEGAGGSRFSQSSLKESTARVFGSTGVAMGRVAVEGQKPAGEFRFTLVYAKRQQGWQMVAAHLAPVAAQP